MSAVTSLRKGLGTAFDVLSTQFQPDVTVTLLKASDTADEFDTVLEIESKRFFEYYNYRKNTLLEIADTSDELTESMAEATHVSIDEDVYVILQADTLPPSGTNPVWQLFLDLYERRTHYATL